MAISQNESGIVIGERPERLKGKVALVTGGAAGLGASIVQRFVAAGALVAVADLAFSSEDLPKGVWGKNVDVGDPKALESVVREVVSRWGKLDILVSNAAIQPHGISLEDTTPELLDLVFRTNSHAIFYGLQLAQAFLEEGGSVIHTSSFVGSIGVPNCPSYAASKASVEQLTRVGAMELASQRIRVNAVAPGLVLTPAVTSIEENPEIPFVEERTPLGGVPTPEEIAPVFEFLASDDARWITGAILPVDGGIAAGWNRYALTPPEAWKEGKWQC